MITSSATQIKQIIKARLCFQTKHLVWSRSLRRDGTGMADCNSPDVDANRTGSSTEKAVGGFLRGRPLQVASALAANINSLSFGAGVGYTSAVLPDLRLHYSEDQISWIATASLIGASVGPAIWSQITPRIGPQKSAVLAGIPTLISWCLLLNISNFWSILFGRIISGVGMGGLLSTVPHYISDISEDSLRGTLGSIMVLAFNVGTLCIYGLGGFLSGFHVALVGAIIPVVFMIVFFPCPESPVYLLNNGRAAAGRYNLKRLRYPRDVSQEVNTLSGHSINSTDVQKTRWSDVFKNKAARKALGISIVMFLIQQISGIIPLLSYVGDIFERAGGSIDPLVGSCIVGAVQIVGSLLSITLIERAGRRFLMLFSCVFMAASHGFLGYALLPNSNTPGWLPVTSLSVFMIAYAVGAGSAPFVIMTELSSPLVRPLIATVAMAFHCIFTFTVIKTYSDLINIMGVNGVFWMYAGGCVAGAVFVFFFLPETSGKSNARIQSELEGTCGSQ